LIKSVQVVFTSFSVFFGFSAGYNQELHYSPPDFFLDILFGWVKQSFKQKTALDAMDGEASYSEQQDMDKTINNNITSNATLFAKNINSNTLGSMIFLFKLL